MMITLPKVQKGTGAMIMTAIDPMEIKGLEPKSFAWGGGMFEGAKIYASHGNFYVLASVAMIAEAKYLAKETGQMITISAPQVQVLSGGMTVAALPNVADKMKALASGQ